MPEALYRCSSFGASSSRRATNDGGKVIGEACIRSRIFRSWIIQNKAFIQQAHLDWERGLGKDRAGPMAPAHHAIEQPAHLVLRPPTSMLIKLSLAGPTNKSTTFCQQSLLHVSPTSHEACQKFTDLERLRRQDVLSEFLSEAC